MKSFITTNTAKNREFFKRYKEGDEVGLAYIYRNLYDGFVWRSNRVVKDDVVAHCIVQEAFLRLWMMRERMDSMEVLFDFLKQQIRAGSLAYYKQAVNRFHRSMLRFDDLENAEDWFLGEVPEDEDIVYTDPETEAEQKIQLQKIFEVLPNLGENQQMFIRLCLKYSFSYDRIAYYLGGVSSYEVARKVEKILESLRGVLVNAGKLEKVTARKQISWEGELSEEQAEILRLRYELQYGFEEIANELQLSQAHVQKQFVIAFSTVRSKKAGK